MPSVSYDALQVCFGSHVVSVLSELFIGEGATHFFESTVVSPRMQFRTLICNFFPSGSFSMIISCNRSILMKMLQACQHSREHICNKTLSNTPGESLLGESEEEEEDYMEQVVCSFIHFRFWSCVGSMPTPGNG